MSLLVILSATQLFQSTGTARAMEIDFSDARIGLSLPSGSNALDPNPTSPPSMSASSDLNTAVPPTTTLTTRSHPVIPWSADLPAAAIIENLANAQMNPTVSSREQANILKDWVLEDPEQRTSLIALTEFDFRSTRPAIYSNGLGIGLPSVFIPQRENTGAYHLDDTDLHTVAFWSSSKPIQFPVSSDAPQGAPHTADSISQRFWAILVAMLSLLILTASGIGFYMKKRERLDTDLRLS